MHQAFRTGLAVAAGGLALLALDAIARRRGSGAEDVTRKLLDAMRPPRIPDETLETRVRSRLTRNANDPLGITVAVEHGCVDLRGAVATRERARIVRAIASVPGVDSVLDLMTEPSPATGLSASRATERNARTLRPAPSGHVSAWATGSGGLRIAPALVGILGAGSGLGLAFAGLGMGVRSAIPLAFFGIILVAAATTSLRATSTRLRQSG